MKVHVCYSYYHVLMATLKTLKKTDDEKTKIIITDQIPNYLELGERLRQSGVYSEVMTIDDQERSKVYYHNTSVFKKIKFIANYRSSITSMYSDINLNKDDDITIYFDRQHLSQAIMANHSGITQAEDGEGAGVKIQKNIIRKLFEKLGIIIKLSGEEKAISTIEVSNINLLPNNLKFKYKSMSKEQLICELTDYQIRLLKNIFNVIFDKDNSNSCIILTQPFWIDNMVKTEEDQLDIYRRIYNEEADQFDHVYIKPHPRDFVEYSKLNIDLEILEKDFPFEMYNILGICFNKYISIGSTSISELKEVIMLGQDYDDRINWNIGAFKHTLKQFLRGIH